jgi:sugar lactone lactonase YvrE
MVKVRCTAVALVALGLLAGCSNSAPSSFTPAAGQNQSLGAARAGLNPVSNRGRVLYIADIDGQPGLGQILVYSGTMHNPQLIRTITSGTGRPFGLWVDSKNILYVANFPNKDPGSVTEFKPGASSPFLEITDVKGWPEAVAVDASGNVYVNESVQDEGYVQVFAPGSVVPKLTIDTGVGGYAFLPGGMAFDPQGNLIVAEQAGLKLQIVKIAPGASRPTPVNVDLTGINGPGMGIDKAGNMYVSSSNGATVSVFRPGQREPSRTISPVTGYGFMNVTPDGAVYEASGESSVAEIAPGSNTPTNTITCQCSAQGAALSR